jgi:hypothetical protein
MDEIINALKDKALLKQKLYRTTLDIFNTLREETRTTSKLLHDGLGVTDPQVPVSFHENGELEFRLRISGDLLVFSMHSNIMTLPPDHPTLRKEYIRENTKRAYFGQIFIYNFMNDSFRYNRQQDMGYMVARLLVNCERKFFIEGVRPLNFLHPEISDSEISTELLRKLLEQSMLTAIETDLTSVPVQSMLMMTVGDKLAQNESRAGEKLGFQFSGKKHDAQS